MTIKCLIILISYLLGAVPFGVLIAKIIYKTDITKVGSKNTGATNVWRTFGKRPGMSTLALDAVKGLIPVLIARSLFPNDLILHVITGLSAIIGHNWSVFLHMKGGKGVATSAGVFFALIPYQMFLALIAFLLLFITTRHVSVGSITASVTLIISTFVFETPNLMRIVVILASTLILIKHWPNLKRLAQGKEPKVNIR